MFGAAMALRVIFQGRGGASWLIANKKRKESSGWRLEGLGRCIMIMQQQNAVMLMMTECSSFLSLRYICVHMYACGFRNPRPLMHEGLDRLCLAVNIGRRREKKRKNKKSKRERSKHIVPLRKKNNKTTTTKQQLLSWCSWSEHAETWPHTAFSSHLHPVQWLQMPIIHHLKAFHFWLRLGFGLTWMFCLLTWKALQ